MEPCAICPQHAWKAQKSQKIRAAPGGRTRSAHSSPASRSTSHATPQERTAPIERGGDDPSDPHESAHHSGIGHRCRGRACGGLLPPCGCASCTRSEHPPRTRAPRPTPQRGSRAPRATAARPARTVR
eukprot:4644193-Prymnesium_polylepis.1